MILAVNVRRHGVGDLWIGEHDVYVVLPDSGVDAQRQGDGGYRNASLGLSGSVM